MKLLVVTQSLDLDSPTLSFYHEWVVALAARVESVQVICLFEGRHALPNNVHVHSLGKEQGRRSRFTYAVRFLFLVWRVRHSYDAVFVHMNQEYVLIAGWLWKVLRKPIYLWRNHYAGSWATDIAALFCRTVFCTSKHSYTARYRRTVLMPVGVDVERFSSAAPSTRAPRSLLFFARMAPSKRPDIFVEALGLLLQKGVSFVASVYGSPRSEDVPYYESLMARAESLGLKDRVRFYPGVTNEEAPQVFASHEIFVNCSPSGMFDKTLFEAAASGCVVLARSEDFKEQAGDEFYFDTSEELAKRLEAVLVMSADERKAAVNRLEEVAQQNSLEVLVERIVYNIYKKEAEGMKSSAVT